MASILGRIPLRDRVRELDRIYRIIENEIMKEMLLVDVGNYQEVKAVKAQKKINGLINMLNRSAIKWSKNAVPEAYDKSYEIAKTRLEILGAEKNEEFSEKTHEQVIDVEIDKTTDVLIAANLSIKVTVGMYLYLIRQGSQKLLQIQEFDFRDEEFIGGLLDDAIRAGETRNYAKNLVMGHIKGEVGEGKFIQIRGRNYNMKKYSDTVAKTRLRTVQSEAVKNSCKEYNNDLIQISSHGTDCRSLICQEYEGNVYSISGRHPVYPLLPGWPPFHCRCQHNAAPTSEAALGLRDKSVPTGRGQIGQMDYDEAMRLQRMGQKRYSIQRMKDEYLKATGKAMSDGMAEKMYRVLQSFTGDSSANMRIAQLGMKKYFKTPAQFKKWLEEANILEDYLKFAPQFTPETTIYRGVAQTGHEEMLAKLRTGEIKVGNKMQLDTTSHWSSELHVADEWDGSIIYETKGIKQSSPISHFSEIVPEQEVMVSKDVVYNIKEISKEKIGTVSRYRITLEPTG